LSRNAASSVLWNDYRAERHNTQNTVLHNENTYPQRQQFANVQQTGFTSEWQTVFVTWAKKRSSHL